jgi:fibronectin type 3 domain-containing protein
MNMNLTSGGSLNRFILRAACRLGWKRVRGMMRVLMLVVLALGWMGLSLSSRAGGWYVGNTAPGEWIQFTNVWLMAGDYRFTANAGALSDGAAMHLEIDGLAIQSGVAVPNTGRVDTFASVHLGSVSLSQGYHTLRAVFETPGISLDWLMLRKDSDTTMNVKASDIAMVRPPTSGMLIAPIVGYEAESEHNSIFNANDAAYIDVYPQTATNGAFYSDYQLRNWYGVPMFEDFDRRTDRFWDITVDQFMASRAQVPFFHCRATTDFTHALQDRAYLRGAGSYEGRWLKKFVEAVARAPQAASSIQIGMFFEDGGLGDGYNSTYGHYPTGWEDSTFADYAMQYWLQPWLDSVPASLLYQPIAGRPIISIYSGTPNGVPQDGQMGTFMTNICNRMEARYGLNPVFIVPMDADASAKAIAWGQAPWLTWDGPMLTMNSFGGTYWDTTSAGSRRRLDTVWATDWDPVTNTGTPSGDSAGHDSYQSPLDANGNSVMLTNLSKALSLGSRLVQEEGFYNVPEGNRIFGSDSSGWKYPNQHLSTMRQFADPNTESLMFEAEDCDQYYKTAVHENLGGSYRKNWYSQTGLDVYRPLHNLNAWTNQSAGPGNLVDLSAGFFDVWALDSAGHVWGRGIADDTAEPTWTSVSLNGVSKFTQLAVGKHFAWALNGNSVYTCELPYSWDAWAHTTWANVSGSMVQLSVNEADVWAVDASGLIYYRRVNEAYYPGDTWHQVTGPGPAVNKVYGGGNGKFLWAMSGTNIYYSQVTTTNVNNVFIVVTNMNWIPASNSNNLTQLSVGSEEVWGINAAGNIFRRNIAGVGDWEAVDGNSTRLAVGENYAWGLSGSTPRSRKLYGFLNAPLPAIPGVPTGVTSIAGNTQAELTWTPVSGAAGYNVKRGTASGGPYTNVVVSTSTNGVDTGLVNGTTYFYVVTAINGVGESTNSQEASVTPTTSGTPPPAPTNLVATAGSTQITLTWNTSPGATSYNIKRTSIYGGTFTVIATGVTAANYTDINLSPDTTYTYVVSAVNAAGESFTDSASASAAPTGIIVSRSGWIASASVNSGNASKAIDGTASTRWDTSGPQTPGQWFQINMGSTNSFYKLVLDATASPNDYPRGYQVEVSNDGVNWSSSIATGAGSSAITTITFPSQTARYIRVTQTGSAGNYWSIHEFNVYAMPPAPSAPANLTAAAASSSQINLTWNASSGANSYNVKRSADGGGAYFTIAGGVIGTNYADAGLPVATTYYYAVSALGAGGESTNSAPVSATTQPSSTATSIVAMRSGNTLTFSWPADHLGWHLQVQTNAPGNGLSTNWVTVPGSDRVTSTNVTINPTNGSVFYRLTYP